MSEKISEQEYLKRFLGGGYREVAYENLLPLDKQKLWLSNKKYQTIIPITRKYVLFVKMS